MPLPLHLPVHDLRGVYCLRDVVRGVFAYYAMTSDGVLLHEPRAAAPGEEAIFVLAALADELDEVEPVKPRPRHLFVIPRSASASA